MKIQAFIFFIASVLFFFLAFAGNDITSAIFAIISSICAILLLSLAYLPKSRSPEEQVKFLIVDSITGYTLEECTGRKAVLKAQKKWHDTWLWHGGPDTYIKRVVNKENGK